MTGKSKYVIVFFMFVTFFTVFEMCMVSPLAPTIAELYGISLPYITFLNLGYSVMGLFAPLFGYYSDHYNIKWILLLNMLIFCLGCLIMIFGKGVLAFVLARAVIGISYYSVIGLTASYSAATIRADKIGYVGGWYKLAFGFGIVISPMLGTGIAEYFGFAAIYVFLLLAGLLGTIGVFFLEPVRPEGERITMPEVRSLLGERKVKAYIWITFALSIPAILFYNYYSIHLESLQMSQIEIGKMYTYLSAGSVIAAVLIILLSERIGKLQMAIGGLALCVITILPLSLSEKWLLVGTSVVFGIGYDMIWGLHFPLSSLIYKRGNSTFLTILSLAMALTNVMTNVVAPFIYRSGGFSWNIYISFAALLLALLLYIKENR